MYHAWEYLHEIIHIDHQFQYVDNIFVCPSNLTELWQWNTSQYQQSIQMFALVPIAIGLIAFLVAYCVIAYYCCCKPAKAQNRSSQRMQAQLLKNNNIHRVNSSSPRDIALINLDNNQQEDTSVNVRDVKLTTSASFCRYLFSFLAIVLIVFCIFIGEHLDSAIIDVQNNWDDSYKPYDICINYAHSIEGALSSAMTQCEDIKNTKFPRTECNQVSNTAQEAETYIHQVVTEMDRYLAKAQVVSWGNSDSLNTYRKYLIYFGICILSFIAVIVLVLAFCVKPLKTMKRCICCNSLLSMILIIGICLIWIVSSVQFAFSINVSDVCNAPQKAILQGVNATDNENMDADTFQIVKYYLYCDKEHAYNPLENYTQNAYVTLLSLNETIYEMMPFAAMCDINNETKVLYADYNQTLHELRNLMRGLKCDDINAYLDNITSDLCESGINCWFLLYSAQCLVVFILLIRSCCMCTKSAIDYGNDAHYQRLLNGDDLQPVNARREQNPLSVSPPSFQYDKTKSPNPKFTDDDVRRCIKYLLRYMEDVQELEKKGEELEKYGYKNSGVPLHSSLVRKAVSILRNYRLNQDSEFIHPLLRDIV